ncbi:MAG: sensor histidine kinase [Synechococcaceae cyanobacterium]|jgi:signal transduction histidine kinase
MHPDLGLTRRRLTLRYGLFVSGLLAVFALGVWGEVSRAQEELLRQEVEQLASSAAAQLLLLHHEADEMRDPTRRLHAPVPLLTDFASPEVAQAHLRIRWFDDELRPIVSSGSFRPNGDTLPAPGRRQQSQWLPLGNGLAYWRPVYNRRTGQGTARLQGYVSVALAGEASDAELRRLRQGLVIGGLLAGLLAFAGSQWMVAASLEPIRRQIERLIRFTADASHELRHPLTAIRALIGSLRHGPLLAASPPELERRLEQIDRTSARMGRLLDDLLLLSRSDRVIDDRAGLVTLPLEELLEDFADLHQAELTAAGLRLQLQIEAKACVQGQPERLRQLLENLLANARRFSPVGGCITLGLARHQQLARLWVDDQGPGIPVTQRTLVFERFWQADPSRHGADHHGLGLSIARAIAEAHGGRLLALEAPGGGCRLQLELPLQP